MTLLFDFTTMLEKVGEVSECSRKIMDILIAYIWKTHGKSQLEATDEMMPELIASFGCKKVVHLSTLTTQSIEIQDLFPNHVTDETRRVDVELLVCALMRLMVKGSSVMSIDARISLTRILASMSSYCCKGRGAAGLQELTDCMRDAIDKYEVADIERMITDNIFAVDDGEDNTIESKYCNLRNDFCHLLAYLLPPSGQACRYSTIAAMLITDKLKASSSLQARSIESISNLLFLISCRQSTLSPLATWAFSMLEELGTGNESLVKFINLLTTYILSMRSVQARNQRMGEAILSMSTKECLSSCTHNTRKDYHEQHWYNCNTCKLVWDKGCCTLCALVCHKGHDVSYARYSSFFCDCGDAGMSGGANKDMCLCLSILPPEQSTSAYRRGLEVSESLYSYSSSLSSQTAVQISLDICGDAALTSCGAIMDSSERYNWSQGVIALMQTEFRSWVQANRLPFRYTASSGKSLERLLRRSLMFGPPTECASIAVLEKSQSFVLARTYRQDNIHEIHNASASSASKSSRQKSRYPIIVSDRRGRVVVAENNKLILCSGLAAVNVRFATVSETGNTPKSALPVLDTHQFDFEVLSMKISPTDDQRLMVWGENHLHLFLISGSSLLMIATHSMSKDDNSGRFIGCDWLPTMQSTRIAIFYSRCAQLLTYTNSVSSFAVSHTLHIPRGSLLLDYAVISNLSHTTEDEGFNLSVPCKVVILLDNGLLKEADFAANCVHDVSVSADLKAPAETSTCFQIKNKSVHIVNGQCLRYQPHTKILIAQSTSAPTAALLFSPNGIAHVFNLLPSDYKRSRNNNETEISPAFHNWLELGFVKSGPSTYYRLCCIGIISKSFSVILCVDFNEKETIVREIANEDNSCISSKLIVGITAFSFPSVSDELLSANWSSDVNFVERMALCSVNSAGVIKFYIEKGGAKSTASLSDHTRNVDVNVPVYKFSPADNFPKFPLLMYEELENISDSNQLLYKVEGLAR
jgi:Putative zinc finger in N-recognin (UBR box)